MSCAIVHMRARAWCARERHMELGVVTLPILVPRVLKLLGQRVVAWRDPGVMEKLIFFF